MSNSDLETGISANKDKLILRLAIISGIIAIILLYFFIKKRDEVYGKLMPVLVSTQDIEKGSVFKAEQFKEIRVPQNFISPDIVNIQYQQSLSGRMASVPIKKGQQILWSFIEMDQSKINSLSELLNPKHNERAVALALDGVSAVAGRVGANDRVDVIGTFSVPDGKNPAITKTKTILQCVTVLAVGGANGAGGSVTLKVTPEEAELLTFAEHAGTLRLLLRGMGDLNVSDSIATIDFSNLFAIEKQQTLKRRDYVRIIE